MNIAQVEEKLNIQTSNFDKENFIYDFLLTYGLPKASITRLKKGNLNLSKEENEISWKKKLYFREENEKDLYVTLSEIESNLSHKQRFVIVTDFETWLAADTKTGDKLDIAFKDLPQYYDFFLPWAGMEKTQHQNENPADVKTAEKMAKLFDEIKKENPQDDEAFIKDLNVFLSRISRGHIPTSFSLGDGSAGLDYKREIEQNIYYKDLPKPIGTRRADYVVEEKVLVELKAVIRLQDVYLAQALNYLKAYKLGVGLLINFDSKSLTFKRLVL